jgi:hypothetical protein
MYMLILSTLKLTSNWRQVGGGLVFKDRLPPPLSLSLSASTSWIIDVREIPIIRMSEALSQEYVRARSTCYASFAYSFTFQNYY